mgnify:CR=1 FL=1
MPQIKRQDVNGYWKCDRPEVHIKKCPNVITFYGPFELLEFVPTILCTSSLYLLKFIAIHTPLKIKKLTTGSIFTHEFRMIK